MNPQLILLSSVAKSVIEIILLLAGACLIGFITAWFYQKSYFTPIIRKLEAEKEELNRKIDGLNNDIANLKNDIAGLNNKIAGLEKTISEKDKEISLLKNAQKP